MSISMGCLRSPDDQGEQPEQGDLQQEGGAEESEGAGDVGGRGIRRAIAHPGIVDQDVPVGAGAGEAEAEGAGHRGFGPAGVGRAVMSGVMADGAEARACVGAGVQGGGGDDEEGGEARGGQVNQIVEPSGGPAEILVAFGAVADHAVSGVRGFIGGDAGQAEQGAPEDRGDHAIRDIFGEAFDRGAGDAGVIEAFGGATDDVRDGGAAFGEAAGEAAFVRADMGGKTARGGQGAGEQGDRDQGDTVRQESKEQGLQGGGGQNGGEQDQDKGDDAHQAVRRGAGGGVVQPVIEASDQAADPDHGMADQAEERVGVSGDRLDGEGESGERHGDRDVHGCGDGRRGDDVIAR